MADNRIDKYAAMAKLSIDDDREYFESVAESLSIEFDRLSEIDTEGVEPMVSILESYADFRDDKVIQCDLDMLENAPEIHDECFVVPKSIE